MSRSASLRFASPVKHRARPSIRRVLMWALLMLGGWQVGSSAYLLAKAHLSQYLIAEAWQATLADGEAHKPWSWADTHPVARLDFPRQDAARYVLEGASGRNMAFAASRMHAGGMPGAQKSTVISAHRDSHFSVLRELALGDLIEAQTLAGTFTYRVTELRVVDSRSERVAIRTSDELVLITCYPFDALNAGGPMRYRVTAARVQ